MTGNTEKYFWQLQEREQKWNKLSQQNKKQQKGVSDTKF